MKLFALLMLVTFSAQANSFMSVKERLRLHLWSEGIEIKPTKQIKTVKAQTLPEELERPLRKF